MTRFSFTCALILCTAALTVPVAASAQAAQQPNTPAGVQQAAGSVERELRRFRFGVEGGIGLDPELIDFGAHVAFAPVFRENIELRPGIEFGLGEITTLMAINVDVIYLLPGSTGDTAWQAYLGAGPTFGLSHRGFDTEETDHVNDGTGVEVSDRNRFDFSDTDFNGGFTFIAGARSQRGTFFEMKATAWGVSNIRLLAGFNF